MSAVAGGSMPTEWPRAASQCTSRQAGSCVGWPAGERSEGLAAGIPAMPNGTGFLAMRSACRPSGGIARGDDLARLLEDSQRGDFVSLARLIVRNELFGFSWQQTYWIPMFQFDLHDLSLRRAPQQVRHELPADFDGWSLAAWFARPNRWLDGSPPVSLLGSNLPAVLDAARAGRFGACG